MLICMKELKEKYFEEPVKKNYYSNKMDDRLKFVSLNLVEENPHEISVQRACTTRLCLKLFLKKCNSAL